VIARSLGWLLLVFVAPMIAAIARDPGLATVTYQLMARLVQTFEALLTLLAFTRGNDRGPRT
jgi:hypothetical protein